MMVIKPIKLKGQTWLTKKDQQKVSTKVFLSFHKTFPRLTQLRLKTVREHNQPKFSVTISRFRPLRRALLTGIKQQEIKKTASWVL